MPVRAQLAVFAVVLCAAACGPAPLKLPAGVTCANTSYPANAQGGLDEALRTASAGDCVAIPAGMHQAAISVPAGVNLAVEQGRTVELQSSGPNPVVTLAAGASLSGVTITSASGIGVLIDRFATLDGVKVELAAGAGILAWCEEDCRTDPTSTLTNVEVTKSAVGLWAKGTKVSVSGGRIAESTGTALGTGYGVVASDGASLTMNGTLVEANKELGLLIDGALDTSAALTSVTVKDNLGRGIWAQGLNGTTAAPRLTLDQCTLDGNRIAGLGARASAGVRVTGGRIANTKLGSAQTPMPGVTIMVGDGVGVYEGTGQLSLSAVTVEGNARVQLIVDKGAAGVSVQGGAITAPSGSLGVIVQNTTAMVDAPNIVTPAMGMELPISAPALSVPVR